MATVVNGLLRKLTQDVELKGNFTIKTKKDINICSQSKYGLFS